MPRLVVLTDRSQLRLGRGLVRTVRECAAAGLTHVVVREHDLTAGSRSALVRALADVPGLCVISSRIPDRHAHGLHLPSPARPDRPEHTEPCNAGLSPRHTGSGTCSRTITPRYSRVVVVGQSCHSAEEVRQAAAAGFDYATLSPFAATLSKPGHGPPVAREHFAVDAGIPVFALGGVTGHNATEARTAGAHGVAVMGEVMRSADPAATVARLLEALR